MPLIEGTVTISTEFGDTATTVLPGPVQVITMGQQGPTGPQGPAGPPAAALEAPAGVNLNTIGTVVVLTTEGTLIPADPTNINHSLLLLGMNLSTGNEGVTIEYITVGEINGMTGLTTGQPYWLGLNGSLSDTYLSAGTVWYRFLGNAQSSTSFVLDPQSMYTLAS